MIKFNGETIIDIHYNNESINLITQNDLILYQKEEKTEHDTTDSIVNPVKLIFNSNGGTFESIIINDKDETYNDNEIGPYQRQFIFNKGDIVQFDISVRRNGYKFNGWMQNDGTIINNTIIIIDTDTELVAGYSR